MMETKTCSPTSKGKSEWINDLVASGFALMPLYQNSKVPVAERWSSILPDPTQTPSDFPFNYGVIGRDDIVVVDVDPRNFKPGDDPFKRLLDDIEVQVFNTYTVLSGGGGMHIYLRKPKGIRLQVKNDNYKGIDIKTAGSFLVGPGSVHPDTGREYKVIKGSPDQLAEAPAALLELFLKQNRAIAEGLDAPKDDEATRARFREFLYNTPVAVQGDNGDRTTYFTACKGKTMGLSPQVTFEEMSEHWNDRCSPPWLPNELMKKVENAYDYSQSALGSDHPDADFSGFEATEDDKKATHAWVKWDKLPNGTLKPSIANLLYVLDAVPTFAAGPNPVYKHLRYNAYTHNIEWVKPAFWHWDGDSHPHWVDSDALHFKHWMSETRSVNFSTNLIHEAAIVAAQRQAYHPLKDYLSGLVWDGIPRIHSLFSHYAGAEDNIYTRATARCFMIAAVARIMRPGCKFDHVVVLEGEQGTGKSTFCKTLANGWHTDIHLDPHNKDTVDALRGKWIIEISEMVCTRKADANALKAFISRDTDRVRLPYGRMSMDLLRQSVFIGTYNPDGDGAWMPDQTGNRRFWAIATGVIRIDLLKKDLNQLWAEAVHLFNAGEPWHLVDEDVINWAQEEQAERRQRDYWETIIPEWLARQPIHYKELATTQILEDILNIPMRQVDRLTYNRVATVMKTLGWSKCSVGPVGNRKRGYRNPVQEPEEDLLADL